MYQILKQDEFCDLVLKSVSTEGTVTSTRKTHQAMLATIPYFDMMFSHNLLETQTKEAKLEMPERLLDCLIQYIYTGEFLFICFKIY